MVIRPANPHDVPTILRLIHDLAVYEGAPDQVTVTAEDLRRSLFGPDPGVFAHVAVHGEGGEEGDAGEVVGFALWFRNYSTWQGRHGIHLEDLFVRPDMRGHGYGKALLQELAHIAVERGYGRVEWSVLDWNEPAIGFYKSLGAQAMDEWTVYRVSGPPLRELGAGRPD